MYIYSLKIQCDGDAAAQEVTRVLSRQPTRIDGNSWELEIIQREEDAYVDFVEHFSSLLLPNLIALERIGIDRSSISVWLFYEYIDQCNLEFRPEDVESLANLGATLCISCWKKAENEA